MSNVSVVYGTAINSAGIPRKVTIEVSGELTEKAIEMARQLQKEALNK